jgi:cytochrome c5
VTLVEFLLARIAEEVNSVDRGEDEAAARLVTSSGRSATARARVLAECEAKRRIVAIHKQVKFTDVSLGIVDEDVCQVCHWVLDSPSEEDHDDWTYPNVQQDYPCATLKALALPYADHPDYQEDWRL